MSFLVKYLKNLSKKYPTKEKVLCEIAHLKCILELPRGTEHFVSDVHGEYLSLKHILKTSSGTLQTIINNLNEFQILKSREKSFLLTLITYPKKTLSELKDEQKTTDFFKVQIRRICCVLQFISLKFTKSKLSDYLKDTCFGYIISEILSAVHRNNTAEKKHLSCGNFLICRKVDSYFETLLSSVVEEGLGEEMISDLSKLIREMAVEELHIIGDIYDRGNGAEKVVDYLMKKSKRMKIDVQFGNHDVLWIGAASGCLVSIATVLRISLRYSNLRTLEEGYGISLGDVFEFTKKYYGNGCGNSKVLKSFIIRNPNSNWTKPKISLLSKMQKAMFIIQKKLESQILRSHPEYGMQNRLLLSAINFSKKSVVVDGKEYTLEDSFFPTIDPKNPESLNNDEILLMRKLQNMFLTSEKLRKQVSFLLRNGTMYKIRNNNLLYHASIPITETFEFQEVVLDGKKYKGKALMDKLDQLIRQQYDQRLQNLTNNYPNFSHSVSSNTMVDTYNFYQKNSICYWLWCSPDSPLFGKSKMATFEVYFIRDKKTHAENKGTYFEKRDCMELYNLISKEFGITGKIIVGHIPVKSGEKPVRCNGKYITIDGGMAKAYQKITGIAGYTLIYDSSGLFLCTHQNIENSNKKSKNDVNSILVTSQKILEEKIRSIRETDSGIRIQNEINDLRELYEMYKNRKIYTKSEFDGRGRCHMQKNENCGFKYDNPPMTPKFNKKMESRRSKGMFLSQLNTFEEEKLIY